MSEERKFGDGTLAAMGRLGLKELRNAINPSRESVADSEMGLYGTQTQGEIAQARAGAGSGPEEESPEITTLTEMRSHANENSPQAKRGMERSQEMDRCMER